MKKNPLLIVLGISALFFFVFVIVAVATVASLTSGSSGKKTIFTKSRDLGVIELSGVIMDSKKILAQLEAVDEDPSIKGLIFRINSPGGAVAPSQEIYDELRRLSKKIPVYASMSSMAASGGYYVACGAKKIFASPGTLTGSIGVIMHFADLSRLYQWAKINPYVIKTGRYKDIGSPNREMSTEEKALLQKMIDNVLGQFRRAVALGRNLPLDKVTELSDGRIFSGEQAKAEHLVDELGGMNETVAALAKEVGITEKPHLIYFSKKKKFIERVFADDDEESESRTNVDSGGLVGRVISIFEFTLLGHAGNLSNGEHGEQALNGVFFLLPQWVQ